MKAHLYSRKQFLAESEVPLRVMYYEQIKPIPHYHDFYELVIVQNGSGKHVTENTSYPISIGDVFVLVPPSKHYYNDISNLKYINILYCPDELNIPLFDIEKIPGYDVLFRRQEGQSENRWFGRRLSLDMDQLSYIEKLCAKLNNELLHKRSGYEFMAKTYFMELLGYLSRCYKTGQRSLTQNIIKLNDMMEFIEMNYCEKISLNDIVTVGCVSLSTANRAFRDSLNMSPVDYLIKVRIDHAAELLRNDDVSILEISQKCGFSDSNYFSKQFKKIMGKSPRSYRKLFC